MSIYLERAKALRDREDVHFNCAQSVSVPFADVVGVDEQVLADMCANFGSGMNMGATCGAITGSLMVLGLAGIKDAPRLIRQVKNNHDGLTDCKDLLGVNKKKGNPRKDHCDGMVYELVEITENILKENGVSMA